MTDFLCRHTLLLCNSRYLGAHVSPALCGLCDTFPGQGQRRVTAFL